MLMRKYLFLFYFMAMPLIAFANDVSIDGITYVLDEESKTAEVKSTYEYGTLVIPETIEYNNIQYKYKSAQACLPEAVSSFSTRLRTM